MATATMKVKKIRKNPSTLHDELRKELTRLASICYDSAEDWADAAGVHPSTIKRFVDGEAKWHRTDTLYKIAFAVGAEVWVTSPFD